MTSTRIPALVVRLILMRLARRHYVCSCANACVCVCVWVCVCGCVCLCVGVWVCACEEK